MVSHCFSHFLTLSKSAALAKSYVLLCIYSGNRLKLSINKISFAKTPQNIPFRFVVPYV